MARTITQEKLEFQEIFERFRCAPPQDKVESMETVHERIGRLRKAKGLTQAELARRLGVRFQSVQQWEAGVAAPRRNRLQGVADALGVSLAELLSGAPQPHTAREQAADYGDPRASELAALFFWLTDPEKDALMMDVRAKAIANRAFLKRMQGKLDPPPDGRVAQALGAIPKKAKR